jgi:hypothetical protein
LPHLLRDWAHPSHICAGTGRNPAAPAPGHRQLPSRCPGATLAGASPVPVQVRQGRAQSRRRCGGAHGRTGRSR